MNDELQVIKQELRCPQCCAPAGQPCKPGCPEAGLASAVRKAIDMLAQVDVSKVPLAVPAAIGVLRCGIDAEPAPQAERAAVPGALFNILPTITPAKEAAAERGFCPACNGAELKFVNRGSGMRFFQCAKCKDITVLRDAAPVAQEGEQGSVQAFHLYKAVNQLMFYIGMHGEIDSKHALVDAVMNELHNLDGGKVAQRVEDLVEKAFMPRDQATRLAVDEYCLLATPSSTEASAQAAPDDLLDAARDVLAERRRQVDAEGWTPGHDDEHGACSMSYAAACYALADTPAARAQTVVIQKLWEWTGWSWLTWWKPKGRRRNLVRAAALLLAEIERIDRAALRTTSTAAQAATDAGGKCRHEWPEADGQTDINGRCRKCGMSFQRYIHTEMP